MVFGAEEGCARQWEERWDNRNRHTHLYTNTSSQAPKRKEGMHAVSHSACVTIYRLFLFFASLSIPSHTDSHPNLWDWGRRSPTDHSTHHASGLPAPAQCILVGWVSLGGWQLGIEGSFWVDWLLTALTAQWPAPLSLPSRLGRRHGRGVFFLVGLGSGALGSSGSLLLTYTHTHTHTRTHARTHTCVCAARLFPTEQMGRRWTAEVWDFPNLGLGTA